MEKREFVIAKCVEGLGLFDQECKDKEGKDKEGKGYPIMDKQMLYEGKQTCKAIDMCGIQAHAGYYMIGSGGKEFEFDIDEYPILYLTMKAEKDTDTCLLLVIHDKEPKDYMRRFIAIGTTDSEKKHCGVRPAEDCFTIKDDNKWHDYTYDLHKLRGDYPDAKTVRMVQFYSGKICNGIQHAFHFSSLVFSPRAEQVIEDLIVHEGESVTLSTRIEQFKPHYKTLYPKTIDEVKEATGVPKDVSFSRPLRYDSPLKAVIPSAEELAAPERAMEATKMVRLAAREYVKGDYKNVAQWVGIINHWMRRVASEIHLATFRNIVVENGGVFHVSKDTHTLYANSITLYGTGCIEADGDLTIDCVSFEGKKIKKARS